MKYKAILFDMDGTLVPMDTNHFVGEYFKLLAKKLEPFGVGKETMIAAVWAGTGAMMKNDGEHTNEEVFWKFFEGKLGITKELIGDVCEEFYGNEFNEAKKFTSENPLAKEAVRLAHEKADIVVLATNPLFPMVGQKTRMSWVGLSESDFDLVTCYEKEKFCKPNPNYFVSVCNQIGVKPEECLMIGNDEHEDMYAASSLGIDCYLVTDTAIYNEKYPWNGPKGNFKELIEMLKAL